MGMRIMHLAGGGDTGGAKTHILTLLSELGKENSVLLVSFREGSFAESARKMGIPTVVIGGPLILRPLRKLIAEIRSFDPDIIHCHGAKANMMGMLAKWRTKKCVLSTIHSDYKLDYMHSRLKQCTFGTINAFALRHMDYYTAVATRTKDLLIGRGFDPEKIYTIYNCIDFSRPPKTIDRQPYLKELGLDATEDDVIVSVAARLNPVKDLGTLIRAVSMARKNNPHIKLLIAGEGEDKKKLTELVRELKLEKDVCFAGWIDDIETFFAASDITVISSLSETFPYSITEGVREGCAAISSDVGGMPDLIEHGVGGYIFKPGNAEELAGYLEALCGNDELRKTMADALYQKASTEFSIDRMKQTQMDIYRSILRKEEIRKSKRRYGVVICGAYGRNNAGDDAILEAIVGTIRGIDRDIPITVMSRRPQDTRLTNHTNSFYIFNVWTFTRMLRRSELFINGGGSLIQDVTSSRSLYYYLFTLWLAKKNGLKVLMYGCGIGPVLKEKNRKQAAKVLNYAPDIITLREKLSLKELEDLGVTRPQIRLAADSAINLVPAKAAETDAYMLSEGLDPQGMYACFALREWKRVDRFKEIAGAVGYLYEKYRLEPVFLAAEFPKDVAAAEKVAAYLPHVPVHILRHDRSVETVISVLQRMKLVCAMRLHALVFSAAASVPTIAVSYDIKVSGFMDYIGSELCVDLENVTEENLKEMIDRALSGEGREKILESEKWLKSREHINQEAVRELLGKEA